MVAGGVGILEYILCEVQYRVKPRVSSVLHLTVELWA